MGPFPVVIGAPHLQQASQVAFTQRDRPVKTLAPQGANQSLTKRICFRAPVRCFQHPEPQVGDRRIERLSIDRPGLIIYIRRDGATIRRVPTGASQPASPPIPLDGRERSNRAA